MRSQMLLVVCIVAVFALFSKGAIGASQPSDPRMNLGQSTSGSGRYQLFQGQFSISSKGVPFTDTNVFKIDTVTGRVWVYREGQAQNGSFYVKWEPVADQ
jgi:hypothetical protein